MTINFKLILNFLCFLFKSIDLKLNIIDLIFNAYVFQNFHDYQISWNNVNFKFSMFQLGASKIQNA